MNTHKPKILESKAIIRFQHCDPFGHLNNSIYLDYFINAREDQLDQFYGVNLYQESLKSKNGWVVASHSIKYIKPIKVMNEVIIRTKLIDFTNKSVTINGEMIKDGIVHCSLISTFVYISLLNGRPTEHEAEWMALFQEVKN
ncbi:MAG: hypothetical protein RLZZ546_267 [Bacteroidota bacterium]